MTKQADSYRTEYRVTGKDRLSDDWTRQTFTDRAVALRWAEARAFVLPDELGHVVREVRIRIEGEQ